MLSVFVRQTPTIKSSPPEPGIGQGKCSESPIGNGRGRRRLFSGITGQCCPGTSQSVMRYFSIAILCVLGCFGLRGEIFTGVNAPNSVSDFTITVPPGATNASFTLPVSGTSWSWLLLRKGANPSDTVFDFSSRDNGANAIYLEQPELSSGTWHVRVRTPQSSLSHSFSLAIEFNVPGLRSADRPVSKSLSSFSAGTAMNGIWQYFRIELATNTMWSVTADAKHSSPDLYIQKAALPTLTSYLKRSYNQTNDSVTFSQDEGLAATYFLGVVGNAGSAWGVPFSLQTEKIVPIQLAWDPGITHLGTSVHTNLTGEVGDYYFRVTTANPAVGAWRTALRMFNTNEAALYVSRGTLPSPTTAHYKAEKPGSKGLVLALNSQFQPNEVWYILVRAKSGARWSLVSGEAHVMNLGSVAADASSGSGEVEIGPEGIRFFRASAPPEMLAWRLWLNGVNNPIMLKTNRVPLPSMQGGAVNFSGSSELTQVGQMLVVPPYLNVRQYFVAVPGTPGETIHLDSRQQPIIDLAYGGADTQEVVGYGYTTYRIIVPPNEIAWQMQMPATNGNPNLTVRRNMVPNEKHNEALSELAGNIADNITLVPPLLSDGAFYVTVFSTNTVTTNAYRFDFQNGPAVVTDIGYEQRIINDQPERVGWRFYRVQDKDRQLTSLGWDLFLENFAPGTRIALRRNMAPSTWALRDPSLKQEKHYDKLSDGPFLQSPDQEADVWYVGVYNPTNALGSFLLTTREIQATALSENQPLRYTDSPPGKWEFFKFELRPEDVQGPNPILGWDLRLQDVTGGLPGLVVRRERLPVTLRSTFTLSGTNWPSGGQWAADKDWTRRSLNAEGGTEDHRILAMGTGRPLQPGTYYVGVLDETGTNSSTFTLLSRWIGPNRTIPVRDLAWDGGRVTNTVTPREAAYYRVDMPSDAPSWKVRLTPSVGEVMMVVVTNWIPTVDSEKVVQKTGKEHYTLVPSQGKTFLTGGSYYLAVVGEGVDPLTGRIGPGDSTFVLETLGPLPETDLGTLGGMDLVATGFLEGGESTAYHFHTTPTVLGFWISLEDKEGNPWSVSRAELQLPNPGHQNDKYGNEGGQTGGAVSSPDYITVADPFPDETIMVKARASGGTYVDASYTLRVKEIIPEPINFDGGYFEIVNRPAEFQFFAAVDVPPDAVGWDLRLTNVLSGEPRLVVCRDALPISENSYGLGSDPFSSPTWPSGARLAVGNDWTERSFSADGRFEAGTVLALGRGRPLQPGRYYLGVLSGNGEPVTCNVVSRGIGEGYSIPVQELQFAGGQAQIPPQRAREASYFKVTIPDNATSWKVQFSATSGESLLIALRDSIPNVGAKLTGNSTNSGGRKMQKVGDEQYLLLPRPGQAGLVGGTYYLAVVSEGAQPLTKTSVGDGESGGLLTSFGEAPVTYLGQVGGADLVETNTLSGGDVRLYRFSVPTGVQTLQARLEDRIGNPVMTLKAGALAPDPGAASGSVIADPYGNEGGEPPGADVKATFLPVVNPVPGLYTLAVKARGAGSTISQTITNASYVLRITTSDTLSLDFEGTTSIASQSGGGSRYFRVEIPTNALGWDVRLQNVTSGNPRMVVCRDGLPNGVVTTKGWSNPGMAKTWPTNYQWAPVQDWTKRTFSPLGTNEDGRILAVGMNRPLEPGVYFVGVSNASSVAASYTILSRGIGEAFSIPVLDLPFVGSITNPALAPREAAYYRVVVPSNSPSWKLRVSGEPGEFMVAMLHNALPNAGTVDPAGTLANGKGMQRLGNEHFVLLPTTGFTNIPAGTNYLAVISEGVNPGSSGRIGTGESTYTITSLGDLPIEDLGILTSEDRVKPDELEGGEVKAYRFHVPPGTYGARVLLENRAGNPVAVVLPGERLPNPGATLSSGLPADPFGNEGGYVPSYGHSTILTIPNPAVGAYTVLVKARQLDRSYIDATYMLRVQEILTPELNFSAEQNPNGLPNEYSGLLQDNERAFFRVEIPPTLHGLPVIGWKLNLTQNSGQAQMRVRPEQLPSDADASSLMQFASSSAIIAPPYLTNGTWYVEVKAIGSTAFTLTSTALTLERPEWQMPFPGQPAPTPGVAAPVFGDTEVDTNGVVLPPGGVLLEQGAFHYYAVRVPEGNYGLLRAELWAISGNPDLYLRMGAVPTLSHNDLGKTGFIYDRSMLAATETEYANWVPLSGRSERQLQPGLWYMAVRASGTSNARYRLVVSTGNVMEIPVHGQSLNNQFIFANDWQYYRIDTPTALPLAINVTFSKQYGDVTLHLRDSVPPGNGVSGSVSEIRDWQDDNKNSGPYANFNAAGTYTFSAPPIRPGQPLYLGFRALSQANISLSVATNGQPVVEPIPVDFYGGLAMTNVEPGSAAVFRVDVPVEATRWRHFSVHPTNLNVYIEQGTLPTPTAFDWRATGNNSANSSNNTLLVTWNTTSKTYSPAAWPWVPGQPYYILVTNVSDAPQEFTLLVDGRNAELQGNLALVDDNDNNALPDVWELYHFGKTGQSTTADSDKDGVSNYDEFLENTNPADAVLYRPRLAVQAVNGFVERSPDLPTYASGERVVLWALPLPGYSFIGWSGDTNTLANPLTLTMDSHKNLVANFKGAGDDFLTALPLSGPAAVATSSNVGFSKQDGEPFHAGNPGGKSIWWRWIAPTSGTVSISTAGSTFNTLLAVYTGTAVDRLSTVASDNNSLGGTNRSRVTFNATAATIYHIAVDGYNGASATINLALNMSGAVIPPRLDSIQRLNDGTIRFTVSGEPNTSYTVDYSDDLLEWRTLTQVTTDAQGNAIVSDPAAKTSPARLYRARAAE